MEIQIGPHLYRNTDGTVEIEGLPQLEMVLAKPGGPLLVTFPVFDSVGKMPAKLSKSTLSYNEGGAYSVTKDQTSLVLTNTESGQEILHIEIQENDRVVIPKGEFYTLKGHVMKITSSEWSVDRVTMKAGETDMKGKPASLG